MFSLINRPDSAPVPAESETASGLFFFGVEQGRKRSAAPVSIPTVVGMAAMKKVCTAAHLRKVLSPFASVTTTFNVTTVSQSVRLTLWILKCFYYYMFLIYGYIVLSSKTFKTQMRQPVLVIRWWPAKVCGFNRTEMMVYLGIYPGKTAVSSNNLKLLNRVSEKKRAANVNLQLFCLNV